MFVDTMVRHMFLCWGPRRAETMRPTSEISTTFHARIILMNHGFFESVQPLFLRVRVITPLIAYIPLVSLSQYKPGGFPSSCLWFLFGNVREMWLCVAVTANT